MTDVDRRSPYTRIVVLEDTHERVQWLRDTFPGTEIDHAPDVVTFLKSVRRPYALAILDHDLGGDLGDGPDAKATYDAGTAGDANGLTGMDAVAACDRSTPVVVWSANPVWGPRMVDALVAHQVDHVVQAPFRADLRTANAIREAYFNSTGVWLSQGYTPNRVLA